MKRLDKNKVNSKVVTGSSKKNSSNKKPELNFLISRIEHVDRIRTAYIMFKDIPIATIREESSSLSGEFNWIIKPIWENWDLCREKYDEYVDIAGIDDTMHKEEYVRRYIPSFVTQRTIPEGRADLFPLLERIGLTHNDLFEVMCRTHAVCGNDNYYVSRTPDKVIDVLQQHTPYDIPDFDTREYGWLI